MSLINIYFVSFDSVILFQMHTIYSEITLHLKKTIFFIEKSNKIFEKTAKKCDLKKFNFDKKKPNSIKNPALIEKSNFDIKSNFEKKESP